MNQYYSKTSYHGMRFYSSYEISDEFQAAINMHFLAFVNTYLCNCTGIFEHNKKNRFI